MQPLKGTLKQYDGEAIILCETVHEIQCQLGNYTRNHRLVLNGKEPMPEPEGGWVCSCNPTSTLRRLSNSSKSDEIGELRAVQVTEITLYEQQTTTNEKEQ